MISGVKSSAINFKFKVKQLLATILWFKKYKHHRTVLSEEQSFKFDDSICRA